MTWCEWEPPPEEGTFRQCRLRRRISDESYEETATWLPEAVVLQAVSEGKCVRFRDRDEEPWSEGWKVLHVGASREGHLARHLSQEYRHHRRAKEGRNMRGSVVYDRWF
jgi:hypothetical protein